jgi:hypothetical protein
LKSSSAARFRLAWLLIAIAVVNSLGWALLRWHYENTLTTAQVTVDYDDTRILADAYQIPHAELLTELNKRGVTSVAVYDMTLANLRDYGRISIVGRSEAETLYPGVNWRSIGPAYRYLISSTAQNQSLITQILQHLKPQSQPSIPPQPVMLPGGRTGLAIPASKELLNDVLVGFDPAQVDLVRSIEGRTHSPMRVTARVGNTSNLNLERARAILDDVQATGASVVIFSEDEVLGYDSLIKPLAREMQQRHLLFGNIEFSKQRGWQDFAKNTAGMLVRVHSVAGEEAAKAEPEMLLDRFVLAEKERDIRVAYIRLPRQYKGEYAPDTTQVNHNGAAAAPLVLRKSSLEQNLDFIQSITKELSEKPLPVSWLRPGLKLGTAQEFGDYPISLMSPPLSLSMARSLRYLGLFLASLGAVGGTLLLLNLFFDFSSRAHMRLTVIGILLVLLALVLDHLSESAHSGGHGALGHILGMWPGSIGVKLIAMWVGCLFPAIAVLWGGLPRLWEPREDDGRFSVKGVTVNASVKRGAVILVKTTLIMLIGPLIIIALLNRWPFFSGTDKFFFPKVTQILPLFIVAFAFAGEVFPHRVIASTGSGSARAARSRIMAQINRVLDSPFSVRVAVITGLLLIAGYIWLARTGNDSGMEISTVELKMRALLEKVFITRPRTKDIFLGNPAIVFAVWFMLRRRWLPAFGAIVLVTIGQADMLNTFCHLHTPLFYSVLRDIHGVWLGIVVGAILLRLYNKLVQPRFFTTHQFNAPDLTKFAPVDLSNSQVADGEAKEPAAVATATAADGTTAAARTPLDSPTGIDRLRERLERKTDEMNGRH